MVGTVNRPKHRDLIRSLSAWVTELVDDYPDYDEYDLSEMIEERTGLMVCQEDFETVRKLYLRAKLQEFREDVDGLNPTDSDL